MLYPQRHFFAIIQNVYYRFIRCYLINSVNKLININVSLPNNYFLVQDVTYL